MEIVSSIAGKIGDYLFVTAGGQLGYLFHYNDNIKDLKERVEELSGRRDRVQVKIDAAKRNGESIFTDVQNWMQKVDKISAEAEKFFEDEVKANKRCLKGWCINLGQRYRFSKEAKEQALAISDLVLQEVGRFEHVSYPTSPSVVVSSSSAFSSGTFKSRNSLKKQIMKALIDDDSINLIGICGMGGVGKTTLVKEIGQQAKEEKIYEEVVMVVVSQNPSTMKIQGDIADMLGVTKSLPTNSELARASFLRYKIKEKKRILVIFDDVWERIKFDEIGIPSQSDHRGCKILITSRSITVCNQMGCQKNYTVETLSKQESWDLLSNIVGSTIEDADINPIAREVIAKCGGLPIAIVTIAGALKGKNRHVWSNAARQLKTSVPTSIIGMERYVISSLELSFKYLENKETQSLFLFCSLFPEDYKIPIEGLVRYWKGLRWFGDIDEAIEDVRDRVHAIVSNITSSFLLIDDGEDCVKMHDVVRDFALTIASKYDHKVIVKAGLGLQEWPNRYIFEDFTCISLMKNFIRKLPDGLKCPNLQALFLQENRDLVIPNSFFQEMINLKVLDLGQANIKTLPNSLSFLINLTTLEITKCELADLSVIGKLMKLEILNLSNSSIEEIPISFSQLSNLRLLDVNDCWSLKLITPGVMQSLQKLEELYINRFQNWKSESENLSSNTSLVELQVLSRLTTLQIFILNLDHLPKFLSNQNLSNFFLRIGGNPSDYILDRTRYSRNIRLQQINISTIHEWVKGLLKTTEHLIVDRIDNLQSISHNLVEEGFNELKNLYIRSCEKIKCLLNILELRPNSTFDNLEKLHLYRNPNLVEVCSGEPPAQAFSKLKVLDVKGCHKMLNVVPSQLLRKFQNLQIVEAYECESLVYVFDCEEIKIAKGETKFLSSLKYLNLCRLPTMSHLWNGDHQSISLHNLKSVWIYRCPKLANLFPATLLQGLICLEDIQVQDCHELEELFGKKDALDKELDHAISSRSLQNLTSIDIFGCRKLRNLFSPSIVKCLVKLKRLAVENCSSIQEIITSEKGEKEASMKRLLFPSLSDLVLIYSRNLTCFSSAPYAIEFPSLERLYIYWCLNMKTFGYGEQVTPKLKEVILDKEKRRNDNINTTLQEFLNEKAQETTRCFSYSGRGLFHFQY